MRSKQKKTSPDSLAAGLFSFFFSFFRYCFTVDNKKRRKKSFKYEIVRLWRKVFGVEKIKERLRVTDFLNKHFFILILIFYEVFVVVYRLKKIHSRFLSEVRLRNLNRMVKQNSYFFVVKQWNIQNWWII